MIPDVYLALEGTGQALSKKIKFDDHIRDTDSQLMIPIGDLDFGIRVDEVWTLIDLIEAGDAAPAAGSRAYPHATYRAYPKDWNGQTIPARPR